MILPADIAAVQEVGVDAWQRQVFWPISEARFRKLVDKLLDEFDLAYRALEEPWNDLLLADLVFINLLAQHFHARAVERYCERHGIELRFGGEARPFYRPDWAAVGHVYDGFGRHGAPLALAARQVLRRIRHNRHLSVGRILGGLLNPGCTWTLGAIGELKREYMMRHGLFCDYPFPERLLRATAASARLPESGRAPTRTVLGDYLDKISAFWRQELGDEFDPHPILTAWMTRLGGLWPLYQAVLARRCVPETLLLGGLGNPKVRCIALAAKRRRATVIGFQHGHNMGTTHSRFRAYNEYVVCTEYVCATQKSADFSAELAGKTALTRNEAIDFVGLETTYYTELWKCYGANRRPRAIAAVMIIGFPMDANRYTHGTGEFFNFRLDAELQVARALRQHGYRVIYQAHPYSRNVARAILQNEVDKILTAPFEINFGRADALVFTYPLTSTFGFALCTGLPMVLIDIAGRDWNAEAYEVLRRHCAMVPAQFDAHNRLTFSPHDLLHALAVGPDTSNHDYVREFMFPAPTS